MNENQHEYRVQYIGYKNTKYIKNTNLTKHGYHVLPNWDLKKNLKDMN